MERKSSFWVTRSGKRGQTLSIKNENIQQKCYPIRTKVASNTTIERAGVTGHHTNPKKNNALKTFNRRTDDCSISFHYFVYLIVYGLSFELLSTSVLATANEPVARIKRNGAPLERFR